MGQCGSSMFALLDCNNFFVAAAKVYMPALRGRAVVVLGSNSACVIARSDEARALGIKMGVPWFKIRHLEGEAGLVALSANPVLVGDVSDRVMSLVAGFGHQIEQYSVDEAFVSLDGIRGDLVMRSRKLRQRILDWVKIPTSVGIGPTKTLAKFANMVAKSAERKPGSYPAHLAQVCHLGAMPASELDAIMATTAVGEVWGVGHRIGKQLAAAGVHTVLDLRNLDPAMVRSRWSVVLERTVRELQGTSCIALEEMPSPRQEIACTRSFGQVVTDFHVLGEAVTDFASRGAVKLRKQGSHAQQVLVFIRTSPWRPDPQYSRSVVVSLRRPTSDTGLIVQSAMDGLHAIYRKGIQFAKAGVILLDIQPDHVGQAELPLDEDSRDRSQLMTAMDQINARYGQGTLAIASAGMSRNPHVWAARQDRRTPSFTTDWNELAIAQA